MRYDHCSFVHLHVVFIRLDIIEISRTIVANYPFPSVLLLLHNLAPVFVVMSYLRDRLYSVVSPIFQAHVT